MPEPITATTLLLAATRALGAAGGKELARRVADLAGLVESQQQLLRSIQRDVRALVEGPQKTALIDLRDAAVAVSEDTQLQLLRHARDSLVQAAAQETDPLRASYAWLLSAATWHTLAEHEEHIITGHLRDDHLAAVRAMQALADPVQGPPPRVIKFCAARFARCSATSASGRRA